MINLGSGDDLLVLGTGAQSNDTIKVEGTNQGTNTIVNFKVSGDGADLIDFSAYLTSKDDTTKALVDKGVGTTFGDNNVTVVGFDGTNTLDKGATTKKFLTFSELTDANITALLNNTKSEGTITNLNTGLSATEASNNVLMVHNDANKGEYKAFHVTTASNATASVKLIGTFDFGEELTGFTDANLA